MAQTLSNLVRILFSFFPDILDGLLYLNLDGWHLKVVADLGVLPALIGVIVPPELHKIIGALEFLS